jgi:hypothetical protein
MHCSMSTASAFMLMPDLDEIDVRFGQLVVLAAALSVVLLGNLVAILLATGAA